MFEVTFWNCFDVKLVKRRLSAHDWLRQSAFFQLNHVCRFCASRFPPELGINKSKSLKIADLTFDLDFGL